MRRDYRDRAGGHHPAPVWRVFGGRRLLAPNVTGWAHMAFPELRADRPYRQPGDDSCPWPRPNL